MENELETGENDGRVLLAAGDSLELAFTPILRWKDALLRVLGLAMPKHMFCRVSVSSILVYDGLPMAMLDVAMRDDSRLVNIETPCDKAPSGWRCLLPRGHQGPCECEMLTQRNLWS